MTAWRTLTERRCTCAGRLADRLDPVQRVLHVERKGRSHPTDLVHALRMIAAVPHASHRGEHNVMIRVRQSALAPRRKRCDDFDAEVKVARAVRRRDGRIGCGARKQRDQ